MTRPADDPLGRALTALNRLLSPDADPAAWQEMQDAFLRAQLEPKALLAVAQEARGLADAIDEYDQATETGEAEAVSKLG